MTEIFTQRFSDGLKSEHYVQAELEARGWCVLPFGRNIFPDDFNKAIEKFRDTYGHECRLRWLPDLLVMRPGDPHSLQAVEVKRHRGTFGIERSALNVYSHLEQDFWLPVVIVFHCPDMVPELHTIRTGRCFVSTLPKFGNPEGFSGRALYHVDQNETSDMDAIFGAKKQ